MSRIFRQMYTKRGKTKRCGVWSMEYRDHLGVLTVESTKCRDRQAARGVLQETLKRVELIRAGVLLPDQATAATHAGKPLQEHLDAWLANLRALQRSDKWRESCEYFTARLKRECLWSRLVDLTYESFDRWVRERQLSARTRNAYREVLVAFCSWCLSTGRLTTNVFLTYPVANVEANPQRPRGAFTAEELQKLVTTTEARSPARALAYRVMSLTGLRVNELRSLRVADFQGDALHLAAKNAKNGKAAVLRLRADLAATVKEWVQGKGAEEPLIVLPAKLVRRLDGDMKAAKVEKVSNGKTRDVHSLRHTFATMLALAKVHPRTAQKLLRHSSIHLTMKFYTDATQLDDAAAIEGLTALR